MGRVERRHLAAVEPGEVPVEARTRSGDPQLTPEELTLKQQVAVRRDVVEQGPHRIADQGARQAVHPHRQQRRHPVEGGVARHHHLLAGGEPGQERVAGLQPLEQGAGLAAGRVDHQDGEGRGRAMKAMRLPSGEKRGPASGRALRKSSWPGGYSRTWSPPGSRRVTASSWPARSQSAPETSSSTVRGDPWPGRDPRQRPRTERGAQVGDP